MTESTAHIRACSELAPGDRIEARRRGVVHFRGDVTELMPEFELFWAVDPYGQRRIIEFSEYQVYPRASDLSERLQENWCRGSAKAQHLESSLTHQAKTIQKSLTTSAPARSV